MAATVCIWRAYKCGQTLCICLIWIWELSLRCLSVSTMTKWHHFDVTSDPEPHNLNRTCLRCTNLLKPLALSGIVGIERPASSLEHTAVLGRMAFLRGSFLRASLLHLLPRHAIANCLIGFSCLGLVGFGFLMAFLDKQCLDALQGINHGPWGFGDCAVRKAVLVPPHRWEWSQDNTVEWSLRKQHRHDR